MSLTILTVSTILIIVGIFFSYKHIKKVSKIKKENSQYKNKRLSIISSIKLEIINENISESFYTDMIKYVENELGSINNDSNIEEKSKLSMVNNLYCKLKRGIRISKDYKEFYSKFSYIKRKYRMTFNKSLDIIELLEEKYGDSVVDKYLVNFDRDYSSIKNTEINDLNKLIRKSKNYFDVFDIDNLETYFKDIRKIHCDLMLKLEEPIRLRDKFISSEDNVSQLESELKNSSGTLYQKVFNIIKNNKVTKEDTDEWNRIKKMINSFKKNLILKKDVIDLNKKLNQIVTDLSDLNEELSDKFRKSINA